MRNSYYRRGVFRSKRDEDSDDDDIQVHTDSSVGSEEEEPSESGLAPPDSAEEALIRSVAYDLLDYVRRRDSGSGEDAMYIIRHFYLALFAALNTADDHNMAALEAVPKFTAYVLAWKLFMRDNDAFRRRFGCRRS